MTRLPAVVIDPHIHQWNPYTTPRHGTGRARLLRAVPRIPRAFSRLAPRSEREFIGHPHHALKPYLPLDYRADAGPVAVRSVVHIEAAWLGEPAASVAETAWVAALPFGAGGAPELGAIVAHVDPRWPDAPAILDRHLATSPLVRGIRHSVTHHDDPEVRSFEQAPDVVSQRGFLDGFAAIAERGLSFEVWVYSHQLLSVRRLVRTYPETTFVLNHYATPVGIFGPRGRSTGHSQRDRDRMLGRWRDDLAALAEAPNVVAKHSGLGMPLLGGVPRRQAGTASAELVERAAPLVRHLHDCFGAQRTMWASNYPIDKPVLALPVTAQIVLDVLGDDADPQQLFHDVAARTYAIRTSPTEPTEHA